MSEYTIEQLRKAAQREAQAVAELEADEMEALAVYQKVREARRAAEQMAGQSLEEYTTALRNTPAGQQDAQAAWELWIARH